MKPTMMNTACYRGFFSLYELTAEGLFLKELTLRTKDDKYLPIAGVTPERIDGIPWYLSFLSPGSARSTNRGTTSTMMAPPHRLS